MKIRYNIVAVFALFMGAMFIGCTDSYDGYNKNGVSDEEGERDAYFLRQHLVNMQSWIIPLDAHAHQFTELTLGGSYGGYFADVSPGFTERNFATYSPESGWTASTFENVMSNPITSYKKVKTMTDDPVYLSISKVMKVMVMSRLTDIYGPVPYSDLEAEGKLNYSYDSQDKVYEEMIADLNDAIEVLTANQTANFSSKADRIFSGNVIKWVKLANSVKLRLAVRMSEANPALAKKAAEEVVRDQIGPMSSNADNASLVLISGNTNPYQVGMLDWNGGDSRISADITTYMNGFADPRMAAYFDPTTIAGHEGEYVGMRNGVRIPSPQSTGQSYSNMNKDLRTRQSLLLMCAAEVSFLKAEAALRGWSMGGSAKDFYEEGIRTSFDQWGVSGVGEYIGNASNTPALYVDPLGAFSYTGAPSTINIAWTPQTTFDEGLEKIITQKWIAIYPNGIEAWTEFRRTGYPKLMPVLLNRSSIVSTERMARRLQFPQSEYTGNASNLQQAIGLLGGADNMATDLWWAKKN